MRPLAPLPLPFLAFDDVKRFYSHPVRAYFQQRLGVYFRLEETELSSDEPFVIEGLDRYQINERLLNALITGEDPDRLYRTFRAAGDLPYGAFGELYWAKQCDNLAPLAQTVSQQRQNEAHAMEISLILGETELSGWLAQVQNDGLLRWRPGNLSIKDGMALWLEHLAYCAMGGNGESRMFGVKGEWRFAPLPSDDAKTFLQELVAGYRQGMDTPLLLLNRAGGAWLSQSYDGDAHAIDWREPCQLLARDKLTQAWLGDGRTPGEGQDPYLQRLVRQLDPSHIHEIIQAANTYLLPPFSRNLADAEKTRRGKKSTLS